MFGLMMVRRWKDKGVYTAIVANTAEDGKFVLYATCVFRRCSQNFNYGACLIDLFQKDFNFGRPLINWKRLGETENIGVNRTIDIFSLEEPYNCMYILSCLFLVSLTILYCRSLHEHAGKV